MRFSRFLAAQLAEPHGLAGTLCGAAMDFANRVPLARTIDLLAPADREMIIDAGCGTGAATEAMLRRADCSIVAIDRSATMIDRARSRIARTHPGRAVRFEHAEIENLPCVSHGSDAVLALNILYFCDRESRMIAELRRALRPGGRIVAYVTHRQSMEKWRFTEAGIHRLYDERELLDALVLGGFDRANINMGTLTIAPGVRGLFARAFSA